MKSSFAHSAVCKWRCQMPLTLRLTSVLLCSRHIVYCCQDSPAMHAALFLCRSLHCVTDFVLCCLDFAHCMHAVVEKSFPHFNAMVKNGWEERWKRSNDPPAFWSRFGCINRREHTAACKTPGQGKCVVMTTNATNNQQPTGFVYFRETSLAC